MFLWHWYPQKYYDRFHPSPLGYLNLLKSLVPTLDDIYTSYDPAHVSPQLPDAASLKASLAHKGVRIVTQRNADVQMFQIKAKLGSGACEKNSRSCSRATQVMQSSSIKIGGSRGVRCSPEIFAAAVFFRRPRNEHISFLIHAVVHDNVRSDGGWTVA